LQTPDAKPETLGQNVESLPDLHDSPGFFLLGEISGKCGGIFRRNAKLAGERLFIQRLVVAVGQEGDKGFAPMEGSRRFGFASGSGLILLLRTRARMTLGLRRTLLPRLGTGLGFV
jgi:hypothetical protein